MTGYSEQASKLTGPLTASKINERYLADLLARMVRDRIVLLLG
jgi:hypothetical protein